MKKKLPASKKMRHLSLKTGRTSQVTGQRCGKVLGFFFKTPNDSVTVRELAVKVGMSRSTIQRCLTTLRQEKYISENNQWIDSWFNKVRKINYYVEQICSSGIVDYLEEQLGASAIILFGSFRKGEAVKDSDIDIFVECAREKEVNLREFEKKLGHKIQVFTKPKITLLPAHLLNNVVNGIKLKGYFTIK
ncbi:MAG: nucleotidyltransferase domain-containing protein [Nanoarchaeota archaeon]